MGLRRCWSAVCAGALVIGATGSLLVGGGAASASTAVGLEAVSVGAGTGHLLPAVAMPVRDVFVSTDGRYVGFCSRAPLDFDEAVPPRGRVQCYRRDRATGVTESVDWLAPSLPPSGSVDAFAMSANGRYTAIAFSGGHVIEYDTATARVTDLGSWNGQPIVLAPGGDLLPSAAAVSSDGNYLLDRATPVRVDRRTGDQLAYDTGADGATLDGRVDTADAAVSGDGRYVAFGLYDNSDPLECSLTCIRLYRKDLLTGALDRVEVGDRSLPSQLSPQPLAISAGGDQLAFTSRYELAGQHVGNGGLFGYVHAFETGTTTMVTGTEYFPYPVDITDRQLALSGDGRTAAFLGGSDSIVYAAPVDGPSSTHQLVGLTAVPPEQTTSAEPHPVRIGLQASFDDGAQLVVPGGALRLLNPPDRLTPVLVTPAPDGVDITGGGGSLVFSFGLWDDSSITADARIDYIARAIVTARDQVVTYGSPDPSFTYMLAGVASDQLTQAPTCAPPAPHTDAGSYPIRCAGAAAPYFAFDYVDGTLTVDPAATSLAVAALSGNTVSAVLTYGSSRAPAVGQALTFTRGNTVLCAATTDAQGRGVCKLSLANELTVLLGGGHYQAGFAGSRNFLPSDGTR